MTTVHERRMGRDGKPYDAIIPLKHASPVTRDKYVADTLREWLFLSGAANETLSDAELLARVRASVLESR